MTDNPRDPIDWNAVRERLALAAEIYEVDASPLLNASDAELNDADTSVVWIVENLPGLSLDWIIRGDMRGPLRKARDFSILSKAIMDMGA